MQTVVPLLDTSGFLPHGAGLLWNPALLWLNAVTDAVIGIAFYLISAGLVYFVWKRDDLLYRWIIWMLAAFVLANGTTHVFDVWTLWHADYRVQGVVKAVTAAVSLVAAGLFWPILQRAVPQPLPHQLRMVNAQLAQEIRERNEAQEELERTRAALAQSQKMDAVGQLTGGIAHDLNNILMTVIGNLELFGRRAEVKVEADRALLDRAMHGAESGASLITKLLAFSRRLALEPEVTDLNKLISSSSELLQSALGETVKLEVVLAGGLWRALIDANLLEAALLNLTINARDAMPKGGLLTVETANAFLDDDYAKVEDILPGQYVMLAVSDTGVGMNQVAIARAFEPFYTTKPTGSGSGLGLSQVYGFVKQSGGHIKLYSELGRGTTVKIYLPRLIADAAGEVAAPPMKATAAGRHELILVIEDSENVRVLASDMLYQLGYDVLEADNAATALRLIEQRDDISLLLTDVVLPESNGRLVAEEARRLRPGLAVVFMSGYTQNAIIHHGRLDPDVVFLGKPFKLDALGRKIREALDRP